MSGKSPKRNTTKGTTTPKKTTTRAQKGTASPGEQTEQKRTTRETLVEQYNTLLDEIAQKEAERDNLREQLAKLQSPQEEVEESPEEESEL